MCKPFFWTQWRKKTVFVPENILEEANAATLKLLSQKSKNRYAKELDKFWSWIEQKRKCCD